MHCSWIAPRRPLQQLQKSDVRSFTVGCPWETFAKPSTIGVLQDSQISLSPCTLLEPILFTIMGLISADTFNCLFRLTTAGFYVSKANPKVVDWINKEEGLNLKARYHHHHITFSLLPFKTWDIMHCNQSQVNKKNGLSLYWTTRGGIRNASNPQPTWPTSI